MTATPISASPAAGGAAFTTAAAVRTCPGSRSVPAVRPTTPSTAVHGIAASPESVGSVAARRSSTTSACPNGTVRAIAMTSIRRPASR